MSERLPAPDRSRFPELARDAAWVRELPAGSALTRIFRAGGAHPAEWFEFREYGPLDARFDPHPEPTGVHPGHGVLYTVVEPDALVPPGDAGRGAPGAGGPGPGGPGPGGALDSAFAACLLEVFQQFRIVRRRAGAPAVAVFETARPLRLLDVSDSDWVAVAGGNAAIASGERARAREWARAIRSAYPELDGVLSASSVVPSARVAALWSPAADALPRHPVALLPLDGEELTGLIDAVAERYGYLVL